MLKDVITLLSEIKCLLSLSKEVLTIDEFASYSSLSKQTIYKYTADQKLPFYRVGKSIFFKREDIIDFLTSNGIASSTELKRKALRHSQRF
ncbi:helix-turn-helix domain-containing protein [Polluticoccus soli]|uniref:helix-turn-helix domain-containing protein n=1 Tax=Polluticoccus soli TaxID=3034150 RepID=UPI003B835905